MQNPAPARATFNFRQVGDVTVIDAAGQIKLGDGADGFRNAVRELIAKDQKRILVNLADVTYIDSCGIGELVAGFTTVRNSGGQFKLLNLSDRVKNLLQLTKVYMVFDVYDDEARAVQAFPAA
jgi:anti-sigma B factor antagonist